MRRKSHFYCQYWCRSPAACTLHLKKATVYNSSYDHFVGFVDHSEVHFHGLHVSFYSQGVWKYISHIDLSISRKSKSFSNGPVKGTSIVKSYFPVRGPPFVNCLITRGLVSCGHERKSPPAVFGNPKIPLANLAYPKAWTRSLPLCLLIFSCSQLELIPTFPCEPVCKEAPKAKSTFVRVKIILAEINASNYSSTPSSVLFQRTPDFILELAFQEGYCIFSINRTLTRLSFCFKFGPAGPGIFLIFAYSLNSMVIFVAISWGPTYLGNKTNWKANRTAIKDKFNA